VLQVVEVLSRSEVGLDRENLARSRRQGTGGASDPLRGEETIHGNGTRSAAAPACFPSWPLCLRI
jgi:hypothetical protein